MPLIALGCCRFRDARLLVALATRSSLGAFSRPGTYRRRLTLTAFVSSVLSACGGVRTLTPQVNEFPTAIFPRTLNVNAFNDVLQCERFPEGGFSERWTPAPRDVAPVQQLVSDQLQVALQRGPALKASDYVLQVFGTVRDGHRLLLINGIHIALVRGFAQNSDEWRVRPLAVCDAGKGEFLAEYDTVTRALTDLHFFGTVGTPLSE
jgi:hypothetical protein